MKISKLLNASFFSILSLTTQMGFAMSGASPQEFKDAAAQTQLRNVELSLSPQVETLSVLFSAGTKVNVVASQERKVKVVVASQNAQELAELVGSLKLGPTDDSPSHYTLKNEALSYSCRTENRNGTFAVMLGACVVSVEVYVPLSEVKIYADRYLINGLPTSSDLVAAIVAESFLREKIEVLHRMLDQSGASITLNEEEILWIAKDTSSFDLVELMGALKAARVLPTIVSLTLETELMDRLSFRSDKDEMQKILRKFP